MSIQTIKERIKKGCNLSFGNGNYCGKMNISTPDLRIRCYCLSCREQLSILLEVEQERNNEIKEEIVFLIDLKNNYNHAGESYKVVNERIEKLKQTLESQRLTTLTSLEGKK